MPRGRSWCCWSEWWSRDNVAWLKRLGALDGVPERVERAGASGRSGTISQRERTLWEGEKSMPSEQHDQWKRDLCHLDRNGSGCVLCEDGVRQANWCLGRRCKSSTAKEQATPRGSASRARLVARRAVKRRQRGRRAELLSIERCIIRSAEAFPLVEGNTGDGASGEPSSGSAVSKNSRTSARPAPGPGRARPCPCVLPRRDRNGKGDSVIR